MISVVRRLVVSLLAVSLLAACRPSSGTLLPTPTPPITSAWGPVTVLGDAQQAQAPAFWPGAETLTAAWIGTDGANIHHEMRRFDRLWTDITPLTVPPVRPYAQQLAPAANGYFQLLWLDAASVIGGESSGDQTRLFEAIISPSLSLNRGPTLISDQLTLRYTAAPTGDGGLWVVWSGGLPAEPTLYSRSIDNQGRPPQPQTVASAGDWPSLVQTTDGTLYLFWLGVSDGQVYRAELHQGNPGHIQPIATAVYLAPGDRLNRFSAGLDSDTAYVFWDITRASGRNETWVASGGLNAANWSQPSRLQVSISPDSSVETGFPGGPVQAVRPGMMPLIWASPADGQAAMLPVAVQSLTGLGVLFLQRGLVAGYEEILPGVHLLDAPLLHVDSEGNLTLSWSEPGPDGSGQLRLVTTRKN